MKIIKNHLLIAIVSLIVTGFAKQETLIIVEVHEQSNVDMLIYSVPVSGTTYYGFSDTIKRNKAGVFELSLIISQPSFIRIRDERFQNQVKLLIEPGKDYHVSMKPQKNVQITGANEKGQMLYTTLPDPDFVEFELRNIVNPRDDAISLSFVHQKISELKQSDMLKFQELLDSREISKTFFDLIQIDRDCYYASMEARFSIFKTNISLRAETKIEDEVLENLKKIYEQYPPTDKRFLFSTFWREYVKNYIQDYNRYIQKDFDANKKKELFEPGMLNTYTITEAKKYLSGKMLESFQANYIHNECFHGVSRSSYEKEFISLFEQFEKDYPQSEYSKWVKPYIDKIISYHKTLEQPLDPEIFFMDNYKTFNTLEEVIKPLLGKKIYIDVWATWCGPCKVEFAYNETLKKMLVENDIQMLYISIDGDDQEQTWLNEIKYHRLIGKHIRANKELNLNLRKLFLKNAERPSFSIPWYILIDEQGNIIEERAKRPSQLAGKELW